MWLAILGFWSALGAACRSPGHTWGGEDAKCLFPELQPAVLIVVTLQVDFSFFPTALPILLHTSSF